MEVLMHRCIWMEQQLCIMLVGTVEQQLPSP
jgi:hypothetical protein